MPAWLIIELNIDFIALQIFMKFGEDPMTIGGVIERKQEKTQVFMIQGP